MRFYRCKCGRRKVHSSMGVYSCDRCDECGSDLAEAPDLHREPKPHEWVRRYDQVNGEPHTECQYCGTWAPLPKEEK